MCRALIITAHVGLCRVEARIAVQLGRPAASGTTSGQLEAGSSSATATAQVGGSSAAGGQAGEEVRLLLFRWEVGGWVGFRAAACGCARRVTLAGQGGAYVSFTCGLGFPLHRCAWRGTQQFPAEHPPTSAS